MKKYETPVILLTPVDNTDIITTSSGDTPWVDAWALEW